MYPNLNAERARRDISIETIAKAIERTVSTTSLKLSGKYPITVDEAKTIKTVIGTDLPLDILFSTEAIEN